MGSFCLNRKSFWSGFNNQALLAFNKHYSFALGYENRYGISELGTLRTALTVPAGNTSLGLFFSHFGYSGFYRNTTGIACGMNLAGNLSAGIQVDCLSERTPGEYDNFQAVTFEAGLVLVPSDKIIAGFHIYNPVPNSLRKYFLPSSITAGAGIDLSKELFAGAEVEMSTGNKPVLRTGFEYEAVKQLWIRGGFSTENMSFTVGTGYLFKDIKLDLGFASHEKLGITSSVSVIYSFR